MSQFTYSVDLVFCIDTTGSMSGLIETVRRSAHGFHGALKQAMEKKGKMISNLRIKVIAFRDYSCDGAAAMRQSEFFELPAADAAYASFLESLAADGGGDEPESGLEALAYAIKSDWIKTGDRRRHVVVLYTDASAHKLKGDGGPPTPEYPADLPASFNEITDLWEGQTMSLSTKRLLLFAPDAYPWTSIATNWQNTIHYQSKAGGGLTDIDREAILDAVSNSV